ncbi:hypothetical protein [Pseudooceanicola endophyticus]|uniref:hypothetical protein n=1 Tax=Pseudooceanicola endophyticus TaxID=2841273 RepID=UPI0038B438F9
MRRSDEGTGSLFGDVDLEEHIPARHPSRKSRSAVRLRNVWYWKPGTKLRRMGCPKTPLGLTGAQDDSQDRVRACECRALAREMQAHCGVDIKPHNTSTTARNLAPEFAVSSW